MTDVIEDVQSALQWTINYLTAVLNNLRERVRKNKHRPINRKTLVRWLAAFLPKPRDPKLYLQRQLRDPPDGGGLQRWSSTGSLQSALSSVSIQHWLEEDLGHNFVHFRRTGSEGGDDEDFEDSCLPPRGSVPNLLTSTPNHNFSSCSSVTSGDQASSTRMVEMEEELAALRKQIALLVVAQETYSINKTLTDQEDGEATSEVSHAAEIPLPLSPTGAQSLDDSGCESETVQRVPSPVSLCVVPPAPPPPPPLPLPQPAVFKKPPCLSGSTFSDMLKERKSSLASQTEQQSGSGSAPDLANVLRDLGNVKLRAVDVARSPGGTPMRRKPQSHASDPVSIIAQALKKKFAAHRGLSPESDKENDSSFYSDSSPFEQKTLKKAHRRLSLRQDDSDCWTPVASPLKTVNV